jgi:antitoxin (DNA-binding transcriptional repressor) of toxin-antitoxin stability system
MIIPMNRTYYLSITEAKRTLGRLLGLVVDGHKVIITKRGAPVAQLKVYGGCEK